MFLFVFCFFSFFKLIGNFTLADPGVAQQSPPLSLASHELLPLLIRPAHPHWISFCVPKAHILFPPHHLPGGWFLSMTSFHSLKDGLLPENKPDFLEKLFLRLCLKYLHHITLLYLYDSFYYCLSCVLVEFFKWTFFAPGE